MNNKNNPFGSPASQRYRTIRAWLKAIEQDRNYSRILFGLPLEEPINPEVEMHRERLYGSSGEGDCTNSRAASSARSRNQP